MQVSKQYYGKPWNPWYIRNISRRLSRPITDLLLKTPVTPNQVTLFSLALALAAALLVASGRRDLIAAGGILFAASHIFDCVDGELARLKNLETELGEWLDHIIGDRVALLAFVGGGVVGVYRQGGLGKWGALAVETVVVLAVTLALGQWLAFRYRRGAPAPLRARHHSYVDYLKGEGRAAALRSLFAILLVARQRAFLTWLFMALALFNRLFLLIFLVFLGAHLAFVLCLVFLFRLERQLRTGNWGMDVLGAMSPE